MTDKEKILQRLEHDFKYVSDKGYKVLGVFLQGSQNYGLDYEGSDIDTKCVVIPSLDEIIMAKQPVSTTLILEDKSHIDVKDIRLLWQCFKRQNVNFLEVIFTDYYYINDTYKNLWTKVIEMSEDIAHYNINRTVSVIYHIMTEKRKALCHPYPTIKDKIDKYGYDNKQLHHIIRYLDFLRNYINGVPFKDCLTLVNKEYLIDVKKNYVYTVEEAIKLSDYCVESALNYKNEFISKHTEQVNESTSEKMDNLLLELIKLSLLNDMSALKQCDVCNQLSSDTQVVCSACGGVSFRYCANCLSKGIEPYSALVGMDLKYDALSADFKRAVLDPSLKFFNKTKEEFDADVEKLDRQYIEYLQSLTKGSKSE